MSYVSTILQILDEIKKINDELNSLRQWKEEALLVLSKLDTNAIGKELGMTIGTDVPANILPKIVEIKAEHRKAVNFLLQVLRDQQSSNSLGLFADIRDFVIEEKRRAGG